MLAIQPPSSRPSQVQCTPNLLPCRIHHDGPANATRRYWNPTTGQDGKPEAYFRGRKLKGRKLPVPEGYRGVVVQENGDMGIEKEAGKWTIEVDDLEVEEDQDKTVGTLAEVAEFQEVVVWGHEAIADDDDSFVKGMAEWMRFSGVIHASESDESMGNSEGKSGKADSRT